MANKKQWIVKDTLTAGIKKLAKKNKKILFKAEKAGGLVLLNNIVNGSPKSQKRPPIKTGHLRGSGSVFVGSQLVGTSDKVNGQGYPNRTHREKEDVITVGFDTPYAARVHEIDVYEKPSKYSMQDNITGGKFVEDHIKADRKELFKFIATMIRKYINAL